MKCMLIGLGNMGRNHARVLSQLNSIDEVVLVDPNHSELEEIPRIFSKCYSSLDEALSVFRPDFAVVAVPTKHHFDICEVLINAGINTLVEKPITEDSQSAIALRDLALKSNVALLPGHIERYNPAIVYLKKILEDFSLDSVYRIEVLRCSPFPPRVADVGVAFDLSVHDLDVINYLFAKKINSLYCRSAQTLHQNHEDGVMCYINYDDQIDCIMNTNWTSPLKQREMKIYGGWGMLKVDFISQEVTYFENPHHIAVEGTWGWTGISEGQQIKHNVPKSEPLRNEYDFFLSGIAKGYRFESEMNSSIDVVKAVEHFYKSIKKKGEVNFE